MINQTTRRLDAEKIRQDFIKSKKIEIVMRPAYPKAVQPTIQQKPLS